MSPYAGLFAASRIVLGLSFVCTAWPQTAIMPIQEIRAGQKGVGRTVFQGGKVEAFQVDILGVLENIGPRQSLILAHLSGGPLAETGVMPPIAPP